MRPLIALWLLVLLCYGAQLHTRTTPLPVVVRRWSTAIILPRLAIRVEIVRL
jgi:hypothetical protein